MAVDPKQRGRGLGRGMLRAFLELVERLRPEMIVGYVEPENYPARGAAESVSFTLGDPIPDKDGMLRFEYLVPTAL